MRLFRMFLLTCSGPRQAFRGPRIRVCEKPRTLALVHADRTDGPGMVEVIRIPKWERVEQPITTTIASDRVQSKHLGTVNRNHPQNTHQWVSHRRLAKIILRPVNAVTVNYVMWDALCRTPTSLTPKATAKNTRGSNWTTHSSHAHHLIDSPYLVLLIRLVGCKPPSHQSMWWHRLPS